LVLALAFLFEGGSWLVSLRQFRAAKGSLSYYEAFRRSKDPPSFSVPFEDSAALLNILIAGIGTFAAVSLSAPVLDGPSSILIGLVLALHRDPPRAGLAARGHDELRGSAGQIAVMRRILVDERRWISETLFLHALNYCMLRIDLVASNHRFVLCSVGLVAKRSSPTG
jgi:hypothetical protein